MKFKSETDKREYIEKNLAYYADYFEAMFFSDINSDSEIENYDDLTIYDIDENDLIKEIEVLDAFFKLAGYVLSASDYSNEQAMHDFWFTKNRHGVGFWENDFCNEQQGKFLTELAESFGENYVSVSDGKIYLS